MKQIQFILALLLLLTYSDKGYSMIHPSDTIPIRNYSENGGEEGEDPNSIGIVPIRCELSDSELRLTFFFYDDLGFVSVTVTNLSTFEVESRVLDSQLGIDFFPFSGTAGHYRIFITTTFGRSFHGYFMME